MTNKGQPLPDFDAAPQQAGAGAQWNHVIPRTTAPDWVQPALQALARLEALPHNWDGYGSPRISRPAIQSARCLAAALDDRPLPAASISPVTGGGINFSWQVQARELDIEILPDGTAQYLAVEMDPATGSEKTREEPLLLDPPASAQVLADWLISS